MSDIFVWCEDCLWAGGKWELDGNDCPNCGAKIEEF